MATTPRALPGFRLSLGFALTYLTILVLIPLGGCVIKAASLGWDDFWHAISSPRALAAYKLSFGASLLAALINSVFGLVVAWVLVRYSFPGKRLLDGLVDLPLALPTAVAGITFASLLDLTGWFGTTSFFPVTIVLVFVGIPFVIRSVQPVLAEFEAEQEEAAASLGASRWQTFRHVILPALIPAWLTGFTLAYARGLGEYGSVIFVASGLRGEGEIPAQLIVERLDEFRYSEAAAIAVVLLTFSLLSLIVINVLQRRARRYDPTKA